MNMYSIAKQLDKELLTWRKGVIDGMTTIEACEYINTDEFKELKEKQYKLLINDFKRVAHIEIDLREAYKEVCEERGYKNQDKLLENSEVPKHNNNGQSIKPYLITISPKENTIKTQNNLFEFKEKIENFCERKMFDKENLLTYSLEQRCGPDEPDLGRGVHTHIIAYTNIYKSDIVKNTISSFKHWCDPQGVDIRPINDIEIAKRYISGINKGGKDDNEKKKKILHCLGDTEWRNLNGLETTYTYPFRGGETSPSITPPNISHSNITIEFT